jgi:hypothetical protein
MSEAQAWTLSGIFLLLLLWPIFLVWIHERDHH